MTWAAPAAVVAAAGALTLALRKACLLLEVSGGSMRPAYQDGDRLLAARLPGHLRCPARLVRRGTVVAIRLRPAHGPRPAESATPTCMIKRVVGLPGDALPDSDDGRDAVPPGHVYVLGDHRETSYDSRHTGPVPFERLTAVVMCRVRRCRDGH
ncbi:S26 family signal peptidase [Streptomyces sp. NRRL B-3648]|uniref:S26 family signal peptidase n=1 Tax=Streptomyces sp. NRRL B-3648 TaxID=1519493 RepID=UPI0006AF547B|nr:S26 family signal peptidase [Streptomyces sp. NRRL B-3648]KOX11493.1 hypothetical protein ADL04_00920 [Streptomyces sp. NRRL B-3648]